MDGLPPSGGANTRVGTAGGTLLVLLQVSSTEMLKTAVLAAVGAAVSFGVSFFLQRLVQRYRLWRAGSHKRV